MPAHPAYPPQHMQNARFGYAPPAMYYPVNETGEYSYATPARPTHQPMPPMTFNGGAPQPPAATMLGRPFDGPMSMPPHLSQPQHVWQAMETPTKPPAQKKKRGRPRKEQNTDQASSLTPQAHAQRLSVSSGDSNVRSAKRAKKDHNSQLPTPPSTGTGILPYSTEVPSSHLPSFEIAAPVIQQSHPTPESTYQPTPQLLPQSLQIQPQPAQSSTVPSAADTRLQSSDAARRSALVITQDEQGRKLEVGGGGQEPDEGPAYNAEPHSPRYITVPALVTNPNGLVSVDDNEVLESAMEWLDNRSQTPRSSPDGSAPLRTPIMPHETMLTDETTDTPISRARKVDKRLQAFVAATPARESLLTATSRIDRMGRVVAVGQTFATSFLGLEPQTRVIEDTDMGAMFEIPAASSSSIDRKPDWPDQEAPWALSSDRSGKLAREKRERDATIRRYLESASEESSDEETGWKRTTFRNKGKGVDRSTDRLNDMTYRKRTQSNWEAATTDATSALLLGLRNRNLRSIPAGVVGCLCGTQDTETRGPMIRCESCKTWHHLSCYHMDQVPHAYHQLFWCAACETRAMAASTPARTPRAHLFSQSEERSSAFKRQASDIALAPSPLFPTFNQAAANSRTPLSRAIASASSPGRAPRARMLSYNEGEFWSTFDEGGALPSTPLSKTDRFSTPKVDDVPFDVTSTPSRHIDFSFGQPSLFSLTPLGGRSRIPSNMLTDTVTPFRGRNVSFGQPLTEMIPSRHDFLKDLNRGGNGNGSGPSTAAHPHSEGAVPASPSSSRWPHGLMGAPLVSPSPFGHRRTASGNKMSSLRSSSKAGLGFAMGDDGTVEEEDDDDF